jgi:hypothetical protein
MKISTRRVRAVFRQEFCEHRRDGNTVYAMVVWPPVSFIQPVAQVVAVPATASGALRQEHLLAIPALVLVHAVAGRAVHMNRHSCVHPLHLSSPRRPTVHPG